MFIVAVKPDDNKMLLSAFQSSLLLPSDCLKCAVTHIKTRSVQQHQPLLVMMVMINEHNMISGMSDSGLSLQKSQEAHLEGLPITVTPPDIFLAPFYPPWVVFLSFSWPRPLKNASQFSSALTQEIFNTQEFLVQRGWQGLTERWMGLPTKSGQFSHCPGLGLGQRPHWMWCLTSAS